MHYSQGNPSKILGLLHFLMDPKMGNGMTPEKFRGWNQRITEIDSARHPGPPKLRSSLDPQNINTVHLSFGIRLDV